MTDLFCRMIKIWGLPMTCYDSEGSELGSGMAALQPMTQTEWEFGADALGSYRTGHFVALAVPDLPLADRKEGSFVHWDGDRFEVMAVRPIRIGGVTTHLWLALRPDMEDFS